MVKETVEQMKTGSEIIKNIAGSDISNGELLTKLGLL